MDDWAKGLNPAAWGEYARKKKMPLMTGILCAVFGLWGFHRFYLHHWWQGLLMFAGAVLFLENYEDDRVVFILIPLILFFLSDNFRAKNLTHLYNENLKQRLNEKYTEI